MASVLRQTLRIFTACVLISLFAVPSNLSAQVHVVNPADLQQQLVAANHVRRANLETVQQFLSSDQAQRAMQAAHFDAARVKTAVSSLSDAELAQLAARANITQAQFAAGNLTDRDLIIILVAIAALILIIVAVR
jgi:hypothetical protein